MNQELWEPFGGVNNHVRKPGRLHGRGELCARTWSMSRKSLVGRAGGKGICGGGNSMSKDAEMWRGTGEKKRGKGGLSQRLPGGHPIL